MYSILIKIRRDRDIYEKYKIYNEENNTEEDYSTSSLNELTKKVEELIRSGISLSDIKAVSEMNTEIDLTLSNDCGTSGGCGNDSSTSNSDTKVEEETLIFGNNKENSSSVNYIEEEEMLIM